MKRCIWAQLAAFGLLLACLCYPSLAEAYPPHVPGRRVYDLAGYMPDTNRQEALNAELLRFEQANSGTQIAVVTVPNTEGETLESYGTGLFRDWGIGQQGQNNGVLLLISRQADSNGNKSRIEVGYGLEGQLPDATCSRIINEVMMPIARGQHNPQGAIEAGTHAIMRQLGANVVVAPLGGPTQVAQPSRPNSGSGDDLDPYAVRALFVVGGGIIGIVLLIFFVVWLIKTISRESDQYQRRKTINEAISDIKDQLATAKAGVDQAVNETKPQLSRQVDREFVDRAQQKASRLLADNLNALDDLPQLSKKQLSRAERELRQVRQVVQEIREVKSSIEYHLRNLKATKERVETRLATSRDELTLLQKTLTDIQTQGFRLDPVEQLAPLFATLAKADVLLHGSQGERPVIDTETVGPAKAAHRLASDADPEAAEKLLVDLHETQKKLAARWQATVQLHLELNRFLPTVKDRVATLEAGEAEAQATLATLREEHVANICGPVGLALEQLPRLRREALEAVPKAEHANSLEVQDFTTARELYELIKKSLTESEKILTLPKQQLEAANHAHRLIPSLVEQANARAQKITALKKHVQDLRVATRTQLDETLRQLGNLMPNYRSPARLDWLADKAALESALQTATAAIHRAEQDVATAARKRADDEEADRRRREAALSSSSSYSSSSSDTSSWSSGGDFGGGSSGGGGASGGFD